ncbi:MAG: double-strand break repair protein AddB [Candidatus Liberibacter ctenarytainae]|uniref:Double-strand break repair protein AddB n=1 Tax=Candidatus Liberibacter ctenarytainae TaxID=2020335 RepID=A0A937DIV6_9HYPH|nr:double-strand break repair protein AddB [Candidatus Liberibacter ctenarytainae]
MKNQQSNIFTIASYSSFFREVVLSLLNGTLVESFRYTPSNPLSLASVTIYVPTKPAIQSLRSEFIDIIGDESIILPKIKPLGDPIEEYNLFNTELLLSHDLNPPISSIKRLLELARLILAWRNRLPDVLRSSYPESQLNLPISPSDAIWLAKKLANIIDIVELEEKSWQDLHSLDNEQYGSWWVLALDFLKIASKYWQERLVEIKSSSAVHHQIALLHAEAVRIAEQETKGPVIVAGSTGSIPATARLMSTIATDPMGAIVLPGLDVFMPENIWNTLTEQSRGIEKIHTTCSVHPQYSLAKLLHFLNIKREDVKCLGKINEDMHLRSMILSQALYPSEMDTTKHSKDIAKNKTLYLQQSFADVALIEANNEREEATAIAITLRMSLEGDTNKKSALITADRNLARRVKLELTRFGIDTNISSGVPLQATLQGSLLIALLNAVLNHDSMSIAILVKHPLAKFGFSEKNLSQAKSALELIALRGNKDSFDIMTLTSLVQQKISEQKHNQYPLNWQLRLSEEDKNLAILLADHIVKSIEPLASHKTDEDLHSTEDWSKWTVTCLENVCFDENRKLTNLWLKEEGKAFSSLFTQIIEAGPCIKANPVEWVEIVSVLISGETILPNTEQFSNLSILGTLESRLLGFDTLILGGLNEGSWPKHPPNNPFLSKMMQTDLGLETSEKYIGQAAHDFVMASGTRRLIYSRSLREDNIPTMASRWLQRLFLFGGTEFFNDLKKRGERYLSWARSLDVSKQKTTLSIRPRPFPPREKQPKRYSFSEIKQLISDPYAIYARKILRLDLMPRIKNAPDKKDRGILFHNIITELIQQKINKNTPEKILFMEQIIDSCFERENLPLYVDIIWRRRFYKIAHSFVLYEGQKRKDDAVIEQIFVNVPATMNIDSLGIQLTGIADRINILNTGFAEIIDYKTGSLPTIQMAQNLIDPQLALEAAAVQGGAFSQINCRKVSNLLYIRLKPEVSADCIIDEKYPRSVDDLSNKSLENLIEFIKLLQSGKQPFISHLHLLKKYNISSEYDHLARIDEWKEDYDA